MRRDRLALGARLRIGAAWIRAHDTWWLHSISNHMAEWLVLTIDLGCLSVCTYQQRITR